MRIAHAIGWVTVLTLLATLTASAEPVPAAETVDRGRALYHGLTALEGPVYVGDTRLPSSAGVCANCHGARGQGGSETGVRVPEINWHQLTQSNANRPTYRSGQHILRAIGGAEGHDGKKLAPPMPTFALTESEGNALLAYLQIIGTEADQAQGIFPDHIKFGVVLPLQGVWRHHGEHIHAGLQERFAAINRAGGIYGRRLDLVVEDAGTHPHDVVQAVDRLVQQYQVFALVGSFLPELPAASLQIIKRHRTPMVATLGIPLRETRERDLTYLLPSIERQIQQLVRELRGRCDMDKGLQVLHAPIPGLAETIQVAMVNTAGRAEVIVQVVQNPADALDALRHTTSRTVIALAPKGTVQAIRTQVQEKTSPICLATLAMFSGLPPSALNDTSDATAMTSEVVGLPISSVVVPSEPNIEGEGLWTFLADLSARTLAEALSRAGRLVDYEGFDQALNSLQGFEPVNGLPVRFTSQQRHGLAVAYIWRGVSHAHAE